MGIEQILQNEIQESQRALDGPNDDTTRTSDKGNTSPYLMTLFVG